MKTLKSFSVLAFAAILAACNSPQPAETTEAEVQEVVALAEVTPNATATLDVEGMTCEMGCKAAIEKHLSKTAGIASCNIDFENAVAVVEYDNGIITQDQIIAEIGEVANHAYSAKPHTEAALNP